MMPAFLKINGDLRKHQRRRDRGDGGKKTAPTRMLWSGPFVQLGNSKVEASFADHRTYIYKGKEVDQQVHLRLRPRGHGARRRRRGQRRQRS